MPDRPVKSDPSAIEPPKLSRRQFVGALCAGAVVGPLLARADAQTPDARSSPTSQPTSQPIDDPATGLRPLPPEARPHWVGAVTERARVAEVRSAQLLEGESPDEFNIGELLDHALRRATQQPTVDKALQAALGDAKRIAVKFNSVGAAEIGTNPIIAKALLERLEHAGYARNQITCIELPRVVIADLGVLAPTSGWAGEIRVGAQIENLARYVEEADAMINVPQLKSHQVAGMSCCLKNISHAVVRSPARYHANGCSPAVGQIIANPEIHRRLRLQIVNALKIVLDRGPDARPEDVMDYGGILCGFDPVAVDSVALELLNTERYRNGYSPALIAPHVHTAGQLGLGRRRKTAIYREVQLVGG